MRATLPCIAFSTIALTACGNIDDQALPGPVAQRPSAIQADACAQLGDPAVMETISGPGEVALRLRCDGWRPPAVDAPPVIGEADSDIVPLVGVDRLVNNRATDTVPHYTQSETSIARAGTTLLTGYNDSGRRLATGDLTGYARSTNNGLTWTDLDVPTTPLGGVAAVSGDPVLAADRNRLAGQTAVFYFANLGTATGTGASIIAVHKTNNGGTTWAQAVSATPGLAGSQDKEWIAVDPRAPGAAGAGNVYVCWTNFSGGGGIRFSRSINGGATFTTLAGSLSSAVSNVQACQVAVNPLNGQVYVSWTADLGGVPTVRFRRSTNLGVTFGPEITVGTANFAETTTTCGASTRRVFLDSEAGNTSRAVRSTPFSSLAVSPTSGFVYLVWHRAGLAGGSLADIAFSRSTNSGVTFSAPVRINSVVTGQQFFPAIAVNTAGLLQVMYYSTQLSATNRRIDTYRVTSNTSGAAWTAPVRVTDVSFDRPQTNPNFDSGGGLTLASCYMGDYLGITASAPGVGAGTDIYMTWADNRLDGNPGVAGVQPDPDIRFDLN